jgi:hypothetical protein
MARTSDLVGDVLAGATEWAEARKLFLSLPSQSPDAAKTFDRLGDAEARLSSAVHRWRADSAGDVAAIVVKVALDLDDFVRVVGDGSAGAMDVLWERQRQIEQEGWNAAHDDAHERRELAYAAVAYIAPERMFRQQQFAAGPAFVDPWPAGWSVGWDKRMRYGERKANPGNYPADPATYTPAERRELLVKGIALALAELDRLDRRAKTEGGKDGD